MPDLNKPGVSRKRKTNVQVTFQEALGHYQAGDLRRAERLFKEIIKAGPKNFEAHYYLANILQDLGRDEEAVQSYQRAMEINPDFPGTYYNMGSILMEKGDNDEALSCFEKALELDPACADIYNSIGVIYQSKGKLDDAIAYYQRALDADPKSAMAYYNLGNVLFRMESFDEAITCYQKALQLDPNYAKAYCNLGLTLQEKGEFDEAIERYQTALRLNPKLSDAPNNLGRVFQAKGRLDSAEVYYRRAIELRPDDPVPYHNLIFLMLYDSRYDAGAIFLEHKEFARRFEGPLLSGIGPYANSKSVDRRLKIGYVSPDFRRHSVAYFVEPVLAAHSREHFEVFCYSSVFREDEVTDRIMGRADHWRNIAGMSDRKTAENVRLDGIDILVDLAGHTSNNRLLLFARKPAPVQLSWIGYPATTGLSSMDYKIVDKYTDPPGMTEQFYTEELIRMPDSFLCYLPDSDGPVVGALPALESGHVTFGSFNNFAKVSPDVIRLWSSILQNITGSRILIKAKSLSDRSTREYVTDMFAKNNIGINRFELMPHESSYNEHLNLYKRIDIGLDTFPYNGTTTTCEALWMGVPVITLAGNTHASRVGVSLLTTIGLSGLVAGSQDEYMDTAVRLASDLNKLHLLRQGLRDMMTQSPMTNAGRFTDNLESCYKRIWQRWCGAG
jgi:predicted O-linked N-acetylglucosamine transferase (SPINDLY family)